LNAWIIRIRKFHSKNAKSYAGVSKHIPYSHGISKRLSKISNQNHNRKTATIAAKMNAEPLARDLGAESLL
jgi:hypothetical protein